MIDLRGTVLLAEERDWLTQQAVGGVILFKRNFVDADQIRELIAEIHALRTPPLLVAVDQEGGRVQRFGAPFTELPVPRLLGHLYDQDQRAGLRAARSFGWLMAAELRAVGVDLSFAPVVDLDLGLAEVIGDRAMHRDADAVGALAVQFLAGAAAAGMTVTAKHFPTHAGALGDSHTTTAIDRRTFDDLAPDLQPYRRLIGAGLHSIMVGHVIFPAIAEVPASLSSWWMGETLRGELGFTGAVLTDDMSMQGALIGGGPCERVSASLAAGADMVLLCNAPEQVGAAIESLSDFVSPPSQLRLMRLRGQQSAAWQALHESAQWQQARAKLSELGARPVLELKA
jgi:beta-N-acetylhexosaminidase